LKILLDSRVFLWAISGDARLSKAHRNHFLDEGNDLLLSVASVWEILIKAGLGRLPLPRPASTYLAKQTERNRIGMLSIRAAHLEALEMLPPLHRDPFDRMLVAQALSERLPMLSVDKGMKKYGVKVL
jgi:PIN domain nuclease of toxin-antitoxin system